MLLCFGVAALGLNFLPLQNSTTSLKIIQLFQMVAMFLLPPFCLAYLCSPRPLSYLHFQSTSLRNILFAMAIMLCALPAVNLLGFVNQQLSLPPFLHSLEQWMVEREKLAEQLTLRFMQMETVAALIGNILLVGVLPAVAEELTFRGTLQTLFTTKGKTTIPHWAIWCTAVVFSAIHFQFYGFIPRMLLGALFGYMLVWTGSIWVPIAMHFVNNTTAVLMYFVAPKMQWDLQQLDAIGTGDTLWLGIVSLVLTLVGIYCFRRSTTMSNASSRMSSGN